jgi:hypothetical protein
VKGLVGLSKCEWITCPSLLHVNQVTPPVFEPEPPDPETDALTTRPPRLTCVNLPWTSTNQSIILSLNNYILSRDSCLPEQWRAPLKPKWPIFRGLYRAEVVLLWQNHNILKLTEWWKNTYQLTCLTYSIACTYVINCEPSKLGKSYCILKLHLILLHYFLNVYVVAEIQ